MDFSADNAEVLFGESISGTHLSVTRLDGRYLGETINGRWMICGICGTESDYAARLWFSSKAIDLPESLRFVDLFAGSGGVSYGVQEAAKAVGLDSEAVLAVDNDAYALEIFRNNLKANRVDLLDLSENEASVGNDPLPDLLIGGPPCQGHVRTSIIDTRRLD